MSALAKLVALATTSALTAATPAASTQAAGDDRTFSRLTKLVEYGDGPVTFKHGRLFKVVFDGKRGDRVTLRGVPLVNDWSWRVCPRAHLERDGVSLGLPEVSQFWTLPQTGRYAFKITNCGEPHGIAGLQLTKLRIRDIPLGESVRLRHDRGYEYAARVRVPETGALMVRTTRAGTSHVAGGDVVQGQSSRERFLGIYEGRPAKIPNLLLEADQPLRYLHPWFNVSYGEGVSYASRASDRALPAGAPVWVIPRDDVRIKVNRPAGPTAVEVGGPGLSFTAGPLPKRLRTATVTSATEQWVRVVAYADGELLRDWASTGAVRLAAYVAGPGGTRIPTPLTTLLKLPEGTSELRVLAHTRDGTRRPVEVRLSPVRTLPPMPTDGTPVEFATRHPGEWVLAPLTLDPARTYRAGASDFASLPPYGWWAVVSSQTRPWCRDIYCVPPLASLSTYQPSKDGLAATGLGAGPWFALFAPDTDVSGSVSLSVAPTG